MSGSSIALLVNPALVGLGLGLASIPIIIHLINRRRIRRVEWAAMDWLLAAMKRHQRRLRLENWLILLLRVAAIALLGLGLARPILSSSLAGVLGGKRSVYLVLDNSYSTEAKVDARSVFERVVQQADRVLASLGPDDAIAVVLTNNPYESDRAGVAPAILQPRTVGDEGAARAREALASVRPRHARARWAETLATTLAQMAPEDVNRHVYVISDLQATDWIGPPSELGEAPDDAAAGRRPLLEAMEQILRSPAKLKLVDVGGQDRRNLGLLSVTVQDASEPFMGRPLKIAVEVANHGQQPVAGAQLAVYVGEQTARRRVPVPELPAADAKLRRPGVRSVRVDLPRNTFSTPGPRVLRVQVTPPRDDPAADSLGRDSERWLAVEVRPRLRVLAWTETSRSEAGETAEDYLRGVYEGAMPDGEATDEGGLPWFYEFEGVRTETELARRLRDRGLDDTARVDLVVLANVVPRDRKTVALLEAFVAEGGGLLGFVGDRISDPSGMNELLHGDDPERRLLPYPLLRPEERERLPGNRLLLDMSIRIAPHPVAAPFTNVDAADWIKLHPPQFWGRIPFQITPPAEGDAVGAEPTSEVVLAFADGVPAIVAGRLGRGRTLWVGTSIDNGWLGGGGWLFRPVLLDEAAMWLTQPAAPSRNVAVGGVLRALVPIDARRVRMKMPGGAEVPMNPLGQRGTDDATPLETLLEYGVDQVGVAGPWTLTYERPGSESAPTAVEPQFAVGVDGDEGALAAADHAALGAGLPEDLPFELLDDVDAAGEELEAAREGELTRWLLYLVLALLLIESFLAMRFGHRSGAAGDEGGTS